MAFGRQSASQPDGAVSAQRTQFQDAACLLHPGQQMKQFALCRRYADGRKASRFARIEGRFKGEIRADKEIGNVAVNGSPLFLSHRSTSSAPRQLVHWQRTQSTSVLSSRFMILLDRA